MKNSDGEIRKTVKKVLFPVLLGLVTLNAAPSGSISGRVVDDKSLDALIGVNVLVEGSGMGAATDLDGAYFIKNVSPGNYDLRFSYIGYESKLVRDVEVLPGEVTNLNMAMVAASLEMESVVVEVQASKASDAYLVTKQKNSSNIQDGISAAQIAKNGDGNAADAAKRISGVTVLDGKYIYVRGLGNRYTNTEMNGAPVPSPEPDKRTVPLNMFPSALLESITAMKTYTPDLPGTFAGGNVNIETKAYPDLLILKPSFSLSHNTFPQDTDNFYRLQNGKSSFWGYDGGSRALPTSVPKDLVLDAYDRDLGEQAVDRYNILGSLGRDFATGYALKSSPVQKPISLGLSFGNRYNPSSSLEWGYFLNSTFSNAWNYREGDRAQYAVYSGGIDQKMGMSSISSEYRTNTGLAMSTGMKLFQNHKLALHYIYTHRSEDEVNINRGFADNFDDGIYLTNLYEEKTINNISLKGDHRFKLFFDNRIEWNANRGNSTLYQPDMKRLNYRVRNRIVDGDTSQYMQMDTYSWSAGPRLFTDGYDNNGSFDLKYSMSFKDGMGENYKLKLGTRLQSKDRAFERRSFYNLYATNRFGPTFLSSIPAEITVEEEFEMLGTSLVDSNYFYIDAEGNTHSGLLMSESTTAADAYEADEHNQAEFIMVDVPLSMGIFNALRNIRFVGGLRHENYRMDLNPYNPVTEQGLFSSVLQDTIKAKLRDDDLLPSANLIIKMPKEQNIRLSFSRTVARPQFREVAPFAFQEFYGGDIIVGNPWLKTTNVYNYDFRYEWYPQAAEVVAVSLFHKDFYDPIESSLMEASGKTYLTYSNAEYCASSGIEFDLRRSLEFIPHKWGKTSFAGNVTYTKSRVEMDSTVTLYTGAEFENDASGKVRPLQGQSDFVFNVSVHYNNLKGLNASLSYNTFSKRISALGINGVPDEYEMPFHSLNFTSSYKFDKFKISAKAKNLLNSKVLIGHENPDDGEFLYTKRYEPGMSFSLGIAYDF